MKVDEVFNWFGLGMWLLSASCLSVIGLRRSAWFGKQRPLFSKWDSIDIKVAKAAGLLFISGALCFTLGLIF